MIIISNEKCERSQSIDLFQTTQSSIPIYP